MTDGQVPALELSNVSRHYGAIRAVDDISLRVEKGARHALIGPNGAGKTTLFGLVAGTVPATAGNVVVAGRDITRLDESQRNRLGIAKTFQHSSLFDHASALENVFVAVSRVQGIASSWWRPASRQREAWSQAELLLDDIGLRDRADVLAGFLSHGERRQLEVALALASRPTLLLLDEPTAGMSVAETTAFMGHVAALPEELTVVIIEHDLEVVFSVATTISVLAQGRLVASGSAEVVQTSAEVQTAYLGTGSTDDLFTAGVEHEL